MNEERATAIVGRKGSRLEIKRYTTNFALEVRLR